MTGLLTVLEPPSKRRSIVSDAVAAWFAKDYVSGQTLVNRNNVGTHDAQLGATSGVEASDPTWLPYTATKYVYLPGIAANYISTPDSAALSITGDIDIRCAVALDDWTPAAEMTLVGKRLTAGNQRSYRMSILTSGLVQLQWSVDGITNTPTVSSTASPTVSDGELLLVRATLDVDNGAVGNDVKFYTKTTTEATAAAGALSDSGWTQLGSTVTTALVTTIFNSTEVLCVGANNAGAANLAAGKFYAAVIKDGINGTTALDWSANGAAEPFATQVATSGQTMTFNRAATGKKLAVVDRKMFLLGTDDFFRIADHADLDFAAGDSFTVAVAFRAYGASSGVAVYMGKHLVGVGGYALYAGAAGTVSRYYIDDAAVAVDYAGLTTTRDGVAHSSTLVRDVSQDKVFGYRDGVAEGAGTTDTTTSTLANALPLDIGAQGAAGTEISFAEMEFIGAAIFRRVLTPAEVVALHAELLA